MIIRHLTFSLVRVNGLAKMGNPLRYDKLVLRTVLVNNGFHIFGGQPFLIQQKLNLSKNET